MTASGSRAHGGPLNAKWDGRPEDYDQLRQCWLNDRRLEFLTARLGEAAPEPGTRILEVGIGTGWLLHQLAARFRTLDFTGVEPDATYVEFARQRATQPNEHYVLGSAETLASLGGQGFRIVLSNDVLHHVDSLSRTFAGVAAVAERQCTWWAIEPNFLNPYSFLRSAVAFGERNFYPRQAAQAARLSGWRVARRGNLFLVPPFVRHPAPWMVALESRFERNPFLGGGLWLRLEREA